MTNAHSLSRAADPRTGAALRKPDLFIVGAPKCGTSAMADYLAAHPEIYMARKEMHLFGSDLRFGPRFYRRELDEYLDEFATRNGERRAGEASVWYLYSRHAASELKAFNPDARILILLRNPVDVLHSLYYQFRFDGNEHLRTFEQALAAEEDRRRGRRISRLAYFPPGLRYRDVVRFAEQVRRFQEVFGREQIHVIVYDDFCADPARTYREALRFLGASEDFGPTDFQVVNATKTVRSRFLRAVLGDPTLRRVAVAARRRLPARFCRVLERIESRLWDSNTRAARRPQISPELRHRLQVEFAPEVERLSGVLGRDLTHWSRASTSAKSQTRSLSFVPARNLAGAAAADFRRT